MQGGTIAIANHIDVFRLIMAHKKMNALCSNTATAYLQFDKDSKEKFVQGGVGGAAHGVEAAPLSSMSLGPGGFVVECKNASMYGRHMREFLIVDFYIDSDFPIRLRSRDSKLVFTDLLLGVGKYENEDEAQNALSLMFEVKDKMIADLESLEVDKTLLENQVCLELNSSYISSNNSNIIYCE